MKVARSRVEPRGAQSADCDPVPLRLPFSTTGRPASGRTVVRLMSGPVGPRIKMVARTSGSGCDVGAEVAAPTSSRVIHNRG